MRLLSIDDDASIHNLLKTGLSSEGFSVTTASTAAEGLAYAVDDMFDCIILDNILPDMNGVSLCAMLRARGVAIPIIGLSVQTDTSQKVAFLDAGADDYMEKPFSFAELVARIRALLRRPKNQTPGIIVYENIIFETQSEQLTVDNKPVYLTRKESKLLSYLLMNRGSVLTRAMILEHVWDMQSDPFSNSIEAHIRVLRKKMGAAHRGRESIIRTVPGRGYIID